MIPGHVDDSEKTHRSHLKDMPDYVGKDPKWNPLDWVKKVHAHEVFVTLDRLPKWAAHPSSERE